LLKADCRIRLINQEFKFSSAITLLFEVLAKRNAVATRLLNSFCTNLEHLPAHLLPWALPNGMSLSVDCHYPVAVGSHFASIRNDSSAGTGSALYWRHLCYLLLHLQAVQLFDGNGNMVVFSATCVTASF
jgi:hypothetical protein